MAKYECALLGDFHQILNDIDNAVMNGSASASREDASDFFVGTSMCSVRVYERFSYTGGNRVSLNVTLVSFGNEIFLSAITSGGSQALMFKINTLGEEAFLETITEVVEKYRRRF